MHLVVGEDGVDDEVAVVGHDGPRFGCACHAQAERFAGAEGGERQEDARVAEGDEFERDAVCPLLGGVSKVVE